LPKLQGAVQPNGKPVKWSTKCFSSNVASAKYSTDGTAIEITLVSSGPLPLSTADQHLCEDAYYLGTAAVVNPLNPVFAEAKNPKPAVTTQWTLSLPTDLSDAERWDVEHKGVRVMLFPHGIAESLSNLVLTVSTFLPEFTTNVPKPIGELNRDFLQKYTKFRYDVRDPATNKVPDESEIQSGDSFYVMRLDGLNSMLAWAMGSTTGHVTAALWMDQELFVVESTIDSAYWPTDHIQKTPYRTWIQQAQAADYIVDFVKLNDQARQHYNESQAVDWFKQNEGFEYGFKTMIWAWLDTLKGNFPCLPPDFSSNCMTWDLLEIFTAHTDRTIHEIGDMIWNAGLSKRLSVPENTLRTAQLYQVADQQGMTSNQVIIMPEQDTWLYETTRYDEPAVGRSMVCCVFVCSTWKAAGVFGELTDSINCSEQTNWDDYAMTIHMDSYQQIMGKYDLVLNDFHTKDFYAHMAETCPSTPPNYDNKPAHC
jgi:hypothetical protein